MAQRILSEERAPAEQIPAQFANALDASLEAQGVSA